MFLFLKERKRGREKERENGHKVDRKVKRIWENLGQKKHD